MRGRPKVGGSEPLPCRRHGAKGRDSEVGDTSAKTFDNFPLLMVAYGIIHSRLRSEHSYSPIIAPRWQEILLLLPLLNAEEWLMKRVPQKGGPKFTRSLIVVSSRYIGGSSVLHLQTEI
jgi:hypothetical protein